MAKFKMLFALFSVLLIAQHVQAVVNKATSNVPLIKENEKSTKVNADDRISNTFASLSDEYGPPSGFSFNGPAPVYGPPELVGNLGPTPIYPPPPAELPPPVSPIATYGVPYGIKPQYGPPKQTFSLASSSLHSKPSYGPPKLHYGPPKQLFLPPAPIPPFRLPKPQYGPPLKLVGTSSQQYGPPLASQHGLPKPGHGPPIPISLETYGPPPPKLPIQFNPLPNNEYGPPPLPLPAPQPQYGSPASDLYGPPPPAPPPGVPAPPTPPDIKYDGWQPIAGSGTTPNQNTALVDAKHNHIDSSSSSQLSHAALTVSTNPNVPSDSYGVPIHNPDAQNLKTSVHESLASSESNGLPPPPLPQYEPLHNNQGPGVVPSQSEHQFGQHGTQNIEPLSIIKTLGFELFPAHENVANTDLAGLSLSDGTSDISSLGHISNSVNTNSVAHHSGLELTSDGGGSHASAAALSNNGDSHELHNIGNDLSLQQPVQQTPSADYGAPLNTLNFGQHTEISSGASLLSPPPLDSYGVPPLSSYSPNGPYPASQGGRGIPLSHGSFGGSFHKSFQNLQNHRLHGFKLPVSLNSLVPPRIRNPIKFKEQVPTAILSNINRYLPPPINQPLPNIHAPVSFYQSAGASKHIFSNSFASTGSLNGYTSHSPIAAPHVQYGTPLSFTDFNKPTPHLTYGAPNFGPPTSFVSSSSEFGNNLYSGISNTLMTYGTPVVNAPLSDNSGYECNLNSLQPLLPANGALHSSGGLSASGELPLSGSLPSSGELHPVGELHSSGGLSSGGEALSSEKLSLAHRLPAHESAHSNDKLQIGFENAGNVENHSPVFTNSLGTTGSAGLDFSEGNYQNSILAGNSLPFVKPLVNFLDGPPVNTLDLQHSDQQKTNLKDSYGNPIGITYDSANEASNSGAVHASTADVSSESSAQFSSQFPDIHSAASFENGSGLTAEALTASLTAQGYGQEKNLGSNEVDASQFLNSDEGSEALSVAQRLTAENADGFEIQGSKGTYRLQIQPADGGLGTENSDGSIRHDQVLSNGLLQDILAAIEQENGAVQLQGSPQQLEQVLGPDVRSQATANGHFITVDNLAQHNRLYDQVQQASDRSEDEKYTRNPSVALFYDTRYGEPRKEIRSVSKSERQVMRENEQSNCDSTSL